jgi:hypothetical protein
VWTDAPWVLARIGATLRGRKFRCWNVSQGLVDFLNGLICWQPTERRLVIHSRLIVLVIAVSALAGCDVFSLDTYWRSGDYELIAIDVKGQMMLAVDLHNGGSIGIVGATVFSLGADEHYIVVKQHPETDGFGHFDRGVTNYFIVTRVPGSEHDKEKGVRGPLSKDEFGRLSASTHLPQFTKTFADLE